ncbi:MAG: ATP-binding cassette domain-containing protein [Chlamydiales bacterium]|nr:ABC transporter ATP-binding protein/permease [Chlamydiales bacterium]NCF70936.1 ATP-binding cassette domain-containing protein [Chlamydiales bacterium]
MKYFFSIIFEQRKTLALLLVTFFAMICLLAASYLEMLSLGLITSGSQNFLELFAEKGAAAKKSGINTLLFPQGNNLIRDTLYQVDAYLGISASFKHLALFLVSVAAIKGLSQFYYSYMNRKVAVKVAAELRLKYFKHIQSLPMSFYHRYNIGSLSSRVVGDAAVIAEAINAALINYVQTPVYLICTLYVCVLTSGRLSLLVFGSIPIVTLAITLVARAIKRVAKSIQRNQESFTSVLLDFLSGIHTVKIYVMEKFTLRKYQEQNERMSSLEEKNAKYASITRPVVHLISSAFLSLILMYGMYVVKLSLSELVVFIGLLSLFYEPVKKFAEENAHIQRGVAAAERMYEVLALESDVQDAKDAKDLSEFKDSIRFENVWFRYKEDKWVLKDLSFEVKKGQTVAIVGPTGAGKSTIVELMPRLYDPQKGQILVDGVSIKDITQSSLREAIAFVPQKPFLFLDTVYENISYGAGYSLEQVQEAAKRAFADEFIQKLTNQYDELLEECGKNLSGGQQQRLAIARALVKQAPILVMDEATSALDSVSEKKIQQAIQSLKGHVTQVIIAHRLSTIQHADVIIYIQDGKKLMQGSRDYLLENCPPFKVMWEEAMNKEGRK